MYYNAIESHAMKMPFNRISIQDSLESDVLSHAFYKFDFALLKLNYLFFMLTYITLDRLVLVVKQINKLKSNIISSYYSIHSIPTIQFNLIPLKLRNSIK